MKRLALTLVLLITPLSEVPADDVFDRALAQVGLTKQTARMDPLDAAQFGVTEFELPLFQQFHRYPFKVPFHTETLARASLAEAGSLHALVSQATIRLGKTVRRGWLEDPHEALRKALDEQEGPLEYALEELYRWAGEEPSDEQWAAIREQLAAIPPEVARQAAYLILAAREAEKWRRPAFGEAAASYPDSAAGDEAVFPIDLSRGDPPRFDSDVYRFAHEVDLAFLFSGAEDLALAVDRCMEALKSFSTGEEFHFRVDTKLGSVIIGGADNAVYHVGTNPLLLIDCGGNDTYRAGAAATPDHPYSIIIDLAGDDTYSCSTKDRGAFGAAEMGYAFLVDCAGNDSYEGGRAGQGAGLFGVGAVLDMAGDDHYSGRAYCQGAAQFGIGILSDLSGDDRYECYELSQGFGSTYGCGMLVDVAGNDVYTANDTDIVNPSPQTEEHNASLAQGCGYGRRADYTDGHSLAGGVGMLIDGDGNDRYSSGVFGQGVGYWAGLGILADLAGNDEYVGVWYNQGSCAHFAAGVLYDFAGDDHYSATHNMAQGAGHDFSLGFLIDGAGNDTYDAPNLSLGGGNANGIGILWERGGGDTYRVSAGTTLGRANAAGKANSLRDGMLCLGLFVDEGGQDSYPEEHEFAKNGAMWTQPPGGKDPTEATKGAGIDVE